MILEDVRNFITRRFPPAEQDEALRLLEGAVIHDGSAAGPRLVRCAAVASGGSMERLRMEVESLRHDWRDVIVEGEYEVRDGKLIKVRDLTKEIEEE